MITRYLLLFIFSTTSWARPFALTDSGPAAPDFEARLLGLREVNEAIEPKLDLEAREFYQNIAPLLREQPRQIIDEVEAATEVETHPAFDFLRGSLYYQLGEKQPAEAALREAIEAFPAFRRAYRMLGIILIEQQRFSEAVEIWLKVIQLGGGDAQSYGLLAYAHLSLQHYQSALVAYRNARMFRPDSSDFRRGEAQCLIATDQLPEAIALLEELLTESPENIDYWILQTNAYLKLDKRTDAIANLEIVRELNNANAESLQLLGNLHLQQNNHRLAIRSYLEVLDRFPVESLESVIEPLDYLIRSDLLEEAQKYLDRLRKHLPENLSIRNQTVLDLAEANIALRNNQIGKVRTLLEPIVESDPLSGQALLLLAETYTREEAWPQAEFYLERALSDPDRKRDALIALGKTEVIRGNFPAALKHLRQARTLSDSPHLTEFIEAIEAAL